MSDFNEIELALIRQYSVGGLQIGLSKTRAERRERIRQQIYVHGDAMKRFQDTDMATHEAFALAFGERLDRRAALREIPDEGDEGDSDDDANE